MRTLDRIGMVFRRSTTDWTWLRLLRSVARSIVAFMRRPCPQHRGFRPVYSERSAAWKQERRSFLHWSGREPQRLLLGGPRLRTRGEDRVDILDDAIRALLVAFDDRRLAA